MGDSLITKNLRRSQHTLANIINLGNIKKHVMDEILCMDSFREGDLGLFDSFACKNNIEDGIESIFECFLKIAGIESALSGMLEYHRVCEKMPNGFHEAPHSGKVSPDNPYSCKARPFEGFRTFEIARSMLTGAFDDSKVNILAYLICLDKGTYYKGEYEVFYIIDYLMKGYAPALENGTGTPGKVEYAERTIEEKWTEVNSSIRIQDKTGEILLNWAKNCTIPFDSHILLFDPNGFFESEALYLSDFKLLCSIIIARKSHKILLSRLWFITDSFSNQSINAEIIANVSSLSDLLVISYSNDDRSTNEVLLRLSNEALTKEFISRTGASLSSFFRICRKIDPLYITCMNLCIEHFSTIYDDYDSVAQLHRICMSRYFRVDSFQGFQQIVGSLREHRQEIPVEKLCNVWRKDVRSVVSMADNLKIHCNGGDCCRRSLRTSSDRKKEVIDRVIYLLEDTVVPQKLLKKCITRKYPRHSVIIILRSGSFKLFKYGCAKLRGIRGSGKNVIKSTSTVGLFRDLIMDELQKLEYSRFYQKIMGFLLKKKILDGCFMPTILSPFSLAILSKLGTNSPDMHQLEEKLSEGLYFYRSRLELSGIYRKFVFGCKIVLYKEWMGDMPIIGLGKELSIDMCGGSVVLNSRGNATSLLEIADDIQQGSDIKAQSKHMESGKTRLDSFGIIYGPETGPGRFSVTDISATRAFSEQLEIRISFVYSHGCIDVSLNETESQKFTVGEIPFIFIGEKFNGVLKSLLYAETNEMGPPPMTGLESIYKLYDEYINPVEKLLRYKCRKGVFIDTLRPFYLSNLRGFLDIDNIIEHKKVRDMDFITK